MTEGKDTHAAERGTESPKRPPWWKRLWGWTEFGKKSGWEWLDLLIVPIVLALGGLWFSAAQDQRQQEIEEQRAQDEALQAYLDQMSGLILGKKLLAANENSVTRTLARARTLTVLSRLDADRKGTVVQFLQEASLILNNSPIVELSGADLSAASLRGADLSNANVSDANLSGATLGRADLSDADLTGADLRRADLSSTNLFVADLSGADLSGASLSNADLSNADLGGADLSEANLLYAEGMTTKALTQQAKFVEGATMPDGQFLPGEYDTHKFKPAFHFTVDEGWVTVVPETEGTLSIETGSEGVQLSFIRTPVVFDPKRLGNAWGEPKEVPAPKSADEWVSWFERHPHLHTAGPRQEYVGGIPASQIDVTVPYSPTIAPRKQARDICGKQTHYCVPLYPVRDFSGSVSSLGSAGEWKDQIIVVDIRDEPVIIAVSAPTDKFDEFEPVAAEVLGTLSWQEE